MPKILGFALIIQTAIKKRIYYNWIQGRIH